MEIDLQQAREFLYEQSGADPSAVEYVGRGAWSQCFGFRLDENDLVIRFGKYIDDFRKDKFASAFSTPGFPVPKVLELGQAFDGYYAISTRTRGSPLESLHAAGWRSITPGIAVALEALRSTDISSTRGYGVWGTEGNAQYENWADHLLSVADDAPGKRTHGWRERLAAHPFGLATFTRGIELLKNLACGTVPRSLIHGDLINRNVLVKNNSISGVFDWGCSMYGDHLYDLAWFEFWAPWYPEFIVDDLKSSLEEIWRGIGYAPPDMDNRLAACLLHIGLDHLAYNAFTENWQALTETAERMRILVDGW